MNKAVYSALGQPAVCDQLRQDGVTTVIVTGGETDVCVLSTVMDAVDAGFRVVLPTDALCSVSATRCTTRLLRFIANASPFKSKPLSSGTSFSPLGLRVTMRDVSIENLSIMKS